MVTRNNVTTSQSCSVVALIVKRSELVSPLFAAVFQNAGSGLSAESIAV